MKYQFCLVFESKEEMDTVLEKLQVKPNQSKLPGKFFCEECNKEVDQKVVNYCKIQFDGHTYCRECQKNHRDEQWTSVVLTEIKNA